MLNPSALCAGIPEPEGRAGLCGADARGAGRAHEEPEPAPGPSHPQPSQCNERKSLRMCW